MEIDLLHYVQRGGIVVYVLIFLNIIGYTIMLWKFIQLPLTSEKKDKKIKEVIEFIQNNPAEVKTHSFENIIARKIKKLECGLNTIKIIASIAPLLGLLGTVIGVLDSFDSITKNGLGDPAIFSNGISVALITTVAGLIVAIPHYIGYNYITGILDSIELKIQQKVLIQL